MSLDIVALLSLWCRQGLLYVLRRKTFYVLRLSPRSGAIGEGDAKFFGATIARAIDELEQADRTSQTKKKKVFVCAARLLQGREQVALRPNSMIS